jgi:hypothetical protein
MLGYYLEKKVDISIFMFKDKNVYTNQEKLRRLFIKEFKKRKIDLIIFDGYLNHYRPREYALKRMLYLEKERSLETKGADRILSLRKTLFYKGKPVAWVMTPGKTF